MSFSQYFFLAIFFSLLFIELRSTPLNNIQDPAIMHTIYGTDKFYPAYKKSTLSLHFTPFFQHTGSASKAEGGKVPAGNIYGRWNMYALFYNPNSIQGQDLRNYNAGQVTAQNFTQTNFNTDFTQEPNFSPDDARALTGSYQTVSIKYEKLGLRGQMAFDFAFGFGLVVKGGVAHYKQIPTFAIDQNLQNILFPPAEAPATPPLDSLDAKTTQKFVNEFLSEGPRRRIAQDLGLDLSEQRKTDLEDMHIGIRWHVPFKVREKDELLFTVAPFLSIGAWLPLAQKQDRNKAFSLSLGNDGFTGISLEGAFSFDFPETVQVSAGGGGVFFTTCDINNYRVPTSEFQAGIIPWATSVTKEPGPLWYVNVSLKAEQFIPDFSFYCDYIYTEHLRDKLTLKETNADRRKLFLPEKSMRESSWKIQNFNAGLKYDLSRCCAFGLAIQSTISSARTYRPTTFLGSIIFIF